MWNFQDFSVIQILREINFDFWLLRIFEAQNCLFYTLANLEALKFWFFLHFLKSEIDPINKNQKPKNCKKGSFFTSTIQNWFHVKSEWWNPEISTLCCTEDCVKIMEFPWKHSVETHEFCYNSDFTWNHFSRNMP